MIPSLRAQRAEAARFRRSLTLVGLTVIAPGSAQFISGNRKVGKIALSIAAGLLGIVLLVAWLASLESLIKLAVQPWLLTTFKVIAFGVAIAWTGLIIDAWRLGHPPGLNQKHRLIMVASTLALAALVSTPFIIAARYATAAHDAVVSMFPSGEVAAASDGRLNILLLGADAGDGRVGLRPDSINLVSIDVRTGKPAMISLPRNLEKARFPDGTPADAEFPRGFSGDGDRSDYLLNATWTYGADNPEVFEGPSGPGATAVKQAVEGTLGIPVHYYVAVDLQDFRQLVDALGGITLRVDEELPIGDKGKTLEPGLQKLDGYHALWYARSRESTSDYHRMARQRCVLGAFLNEADPQSVLTNFLDLASASKSVVTTDIPREDLGNLVDLALKAKGQKMSSLQFVPPLIAPADPDFSLIADKTQDLLDSDAASTDPAPSATGNGADSPKADEPDAQDQHAEPGGDVTAGATPDPAEPVDVSSVCSYE